MPMSYNVYEGSKWSDLKHLYQPGAFVVVHPQKQQLRDVGDTSPIVDTKCVATRSSLLRVRSGPSALVLNTGALVPSGAASR